MNAPCVAVAVSGGRDSMALLHATVRVARGTSVRVVALHVHHGLSRHADEWVEAVREFAASLRSEGGDVGFFVHRLKDGPPAGASLEAWAREERYAALASMAHAHAARLVLLAHHRRDQAETFLLQALRGGGVAGLAGMPARASRQGIEWARPWLDYPREAIDRYVVLYSIPYVDDDSNAHERRARNRLRLRVWPALTQAFEAAEASLAMSAAWLAQATECLDELAAMDLAHVASDDGLDIGRWNELSAARSANVLRVWLRGQDVTAPATLIERLHIELASAGNGASWPAPNGSLWRHRDRLEFSPGTPQPPDHRSLETVLRIPRGGLYRLSGWNGTLVVRRASADECGLPLAWLAEVELRERLGGERFQSGKGRPARSLKKQFQAFGIAARDRGGPLIYRQEQLLFVGGLGMDARAVVNDGARFVLTWRRGTR